MTSVNTINIRVTDREGNVHNVPWESSETLMEALRDNGLPVLASCGGTRACATCHVFIDDEHVRNLMGDRHADETELVAESSSFQPDKSRLSCQIPFNEGLDNLSITLAPYE